MSLKIKNRAVLLLWCVLHTAVASAQHDTYQYKAALDEVPQDGFYKVALTPAITGRCYSDARHDIRVLHNGQQVPYIPEHGIVMPVRKAILPVMRTGTDTTRQFFVIFENPALLLIDHLLLDIENADVVRALTLSGSDDNINWYAIREDFNWNESAESQKGLTFPAIHYRYLKLVFNGAGKLPVKVKKAETITPGSNIQSYMLLPSPIITQRDSSRASFVTLKFDHKYLVSKLELTVSGPKYFHRVATINIPVGQDDSRIASVALSSGAQTITMVTPPADEIKVYIRNEDSPPIHIDAVRAFQDAQYLITYLEKGQSYQLVFGDSMAHAPVYDLAFFKDSIGRQIPELGVGAINEARQDIAADTTQARDNKWLLWLVLIVILASLSVVTFKMVKKVGGEKSA